MSYSEGFSASAGYEMDSSGYDASDGYYNPPDSPAVCDSSYGYYDSSDSPAVCTSSDGYYNDSSVWTISGRHYRSTRSASME